MTPQMMSSVGAQLQEDTWDVVRCWSSAARAHHHSGKNFKSEVWHKNNKALIKAGNLKGLLGYPTCKLVECISAILKIEDEKIC